MAIAGNAAFDAYDKLLYEGLAPELARSVLPVGTYTEWYWQNDLHNTLHFLALRLDEHAQYEVRVYAEAMLKLLQPHFPTVIEAWMAGHTHLKIT
jgi:thymidylate synthase (FAD)